MSRLLDIPVRVEPLVRIGSAAGLEPPGRVGGLGGGVAAILFEVAGLLERLVKEAVPGAIDLRSLPMSPLDRAELLRALGEGEVQATVNAEGLSMMRETRVPGVWWVEHFNPRGELIAELLEVDRVPQMLSCAPDEIAAGARALREQAAAAAAPSPATAHD